MEKDDLAENKLDVDAVFSVDIGHTHSSFRESSTVRLKLGIGSVNPFPDRSKNRSEGEKAQFTIDENFIPVVLKLL